MRQQGGLRQPTGTHPHHTPTPNHSRPAVTKLRSLERCSAALLMGCSSGRLRVRQHYEPAGAVLAYLLAGEDGGCSPMLATHLNQAAPGISAGGPATKALPQSLPFDHRF